MWNLHPGGGLTALGTSPLITTSVLRAVGSGTGTAAIRASVYGCNGFKITSSVTPCSTIFPRYMTAIRSHM